MWKTLIRTTDDWSVALLRLALGVVILPHGLQKALGWFGGPGLSGTIGYFDQALSVPAVLTVLVVLAEVAGGLGLIAGALSRVAALGVAAVMVGAVALVHAKVGFFMNWTGTAPGEGFEYHILALAIALAVAIKGGGALSVDRAITRRVALAAGESRSDPQAASRRSLAA